MSDVKKLFGVNETKDRPTGKPLGQMRRDMILSGDYDMEEGDLPTKDQITGPINQIELFLDMDNTGHLVYSDDDLDRLGEAGFVPSGGDEGGGEFYYHPTHWRMAEDGERDVPRAHGYDTSMVPLTHAAEKWGREEYGSWSDVGSSRFHDDEDYREDGE